MRPSAWAFGCRQTRTVMFIRRVPFEPEAWTSDAAFLAPAVMVISSPSRMLRALSLVLRWSARRLQVTGEERSDFQPPQRAVCDFRPLRGAVSFVAALLHLDVLIDQGLLVQHRPATVAAELPGADVGELVVVPQRLAVLGLGLGPEVATTGLAPDERIDAHQLT